MTDHLLRNLSVDELFKRRAAIMTELDNTPYHRWPLSYEHLVRLYAAVNVELLLRNEVAEYTREELEYVSDAGTLEDALLRLDERRQELTDRDGSY